MNTRQAQPGVTDDARSARKGPFVTTKERIHAALGALQMQSKAWANPTPASRGTIREANRVMFAHQGECTAIGRLATRERKAVEEFTVASVCLLGVESGYFTLAAEVNA